MINYTLPKKKMSTSFERVFRPIKIEGYSGPQLFREIQLHFIHMLDPETGVIVSTKLDKTVQLKYYKVAGLNERSSNGESVVDYVPPDDPAGNPVKLRLVALSEDVNGFPVLR